MRFVAVLALHVHFKMEVVLSDSRYIAMALQTVFAIGLHFARHMRLVALIAIELHRRIIAVLDFYGLLDDTRIRLEEPHIHGSVCNQLLPDAIIIAMAEEAFFPARLDVGSAISMTVDAGKSAHAYAMHLLARMAFQTELFRGQKVVQSALVCLDLTMALSAFDLFHVYMLGMENGFVNFFARALGMTFVAHLLTNDDLSMPSRDRVRPVEHKADEQLVLLRNCQMMALMTAECFMFAL